MFRFAQSRKVCRAAQSYLQSDRADADEYHAGVLKEHGYHEFSGYYSLPSGRVGEGVTSFNFSSALHSWSGHEVGRLPHRMPFILSITSSMCWPVTSLLTPCRLPLHPPRKNTCWIMLFSSAVTSINFEHVPVVVYCICFVFMVQK